MNRLAYMGVFVATFNLHCVIRFELQTVSRKAPFIEKVWLGDEEDYMFLTYTLAGCRAMNEALYCSLP